MIAACESGSGDLMKEPVLMNVCESGGSKVQSWTKSGRVEGELELHGGSQEL